MKLKRILALVTTVGILGMAALPAIAGAGSMTAQQNIVQVAAADHQLSTLVTLVKSAGLVKALSGTAKLTVFAPTNAAFAKLPKATLAKLAHSKTLLASVLEYHVVKGALTAAQVEKRSSLKTLEGASLTVRTAGGSVYINQAKVITPNVMASNGVVHVINAVLTPPAG